MELWSTAKVLCRDYGAYVENSGAKNSSLSCAWVSSKSRQIILYGIWFFFMHEFESTQGEKLACQIAGLHFARAFVAALAELLRLAFQMFCIFPIAAAIFPFLFAVWPRQANLTHITFVSTFAGQENPFHPHCQCP